MHDSHASKKRATSLNSFRFILNLTFIILDYIYNFLQIKSYKPIIVSEVAI